MVRINVPERLSEIISRLEKAGHKAYPVGGCVRDSLRGGAPKDWDAATSALPEEVKDAMSGTGFKIIETGIKHGTVTILARGEAYEITTFRVDGGYSDNRRPDSVEFVADINEDLSRRDFTINAIAYDCENDVIIDPFGGAEDIERRLVRCVGEPEKRFSEDSLRILRGLRFASVLGFEIEARTAAAMRRLAPLLKNVSSERVYAELKMILCGENIETVLREYRGVFACVLPELEPMFDFPQQNPYHCYDVWEHTIHAVPAVPPESVLRLAALFHDSGKPACHTRETLADGSRIDHFYDHAAVSAELIAGALERLKADNRTKERAEYLVLHHGDMISPTKKSVKRRLSRISAEFENGREMFDMLIALKLADVSAQAEHVRGTRKAELREVVKIADEITAESECLSIKDLAISGYDVMDMGFSGPEVGKVLNSVLEAVISEEAANDSDSIREYINKL